MGAVAPQGALEVAPVDLNDDAIVREVVALAGRALGWRRGEPNEDLFRWKHLANPFGTSPAWVARVGGTLAGFRTLMRWEWVGPDGTVQRAVRAVDTATDPAFQGRGIFRTLTLEAVRALVDDGVDFVFNTPNDQSRPGYLKMGWQELGRVPVAAGPLSMGGAVRMARARVPAAKWSEEVALGVPAVDVLGDRVAVARLLGDQPPPGGLTTRRSPEFLGWRYAAGPLRYRAFLAGTRPDEGFALFRVRRRGAARELTLCDVVVPSGSPVSRTELVGRLRRAARGAGVDYLIAAERRPLTRWSVRLPGQGPRLTWRPLCRQVAPRLGSWELCLGDLELF